MRNTIRATIAHPLTPVAVLSLLAAWSFLLHPSLRTGIDATIHVLRASELGYILRTGTLYSRWAPDLYFGYGYPVFNYYTPLVYYLANAFSLAMPGGIVFGMKAVIVGTYLLAGFSIYGIVQRLTTHHGGLIATTTYLFAPYFYITEPHQRGAYTEFAALAIGPFALWALMTYQAAPTRRRLIVASLGIAALILTHNLMALCFFAIYCTYTLWQSVVERPDIRQMGRWVLPLGFGLMLPAFFWLVVLLEQDAVQLNNLIATANFDYRNHFVPLGELLAFSRPLDTTDLLFGLYLNLGVAQWGLALIGFIGVLTRDRTKLPSAAFWMVLGLAFCFMTMQISQPLWEVIPQLAFFQFPWRLLGPALLCIAILSGHVVTWMPEHMAPKAASLTLAVPLLLTLPILAPTPWAPFGPTDRTAIYKFDLREIAIGTTSTGDFIPAAVADPPGPVPAITNEYWADDPLIDRVNHDMLPPDATVTIEQQRPARYTYALSSPEPFDLQLYQFDFLGWRASLDGEPVAITPTDPEGWMTIAVPAGEHTLRMWMGPTPVRIAGMIVSGVGLLGVIGAAMMLPAHPPHREPATGDWYWLPVVAAFIVIGGISLETSLFQPHSQGFLSRPVEREVHAVLEDDLVLESYYISRQRVERGGIIFVTLRWQALTIPDTNYSVFIHFTSADLPKVITQSDKPRTAELATSRWPVAYTLWDTHAIQVPDDIPPGTYVLRVGLWDRSTGERLSVVSGDITTQFETLRLEPTLIVR